MTTQLHDIVTSTLMIGGFLTALATVGLLH
jgi:hypothetical protein